MSAALVAPARPEEAEQLHAIAQAAFRDACPPGHDPHAAQEIIDSVLSAQGFADWIADPTAAVLVVRPDAQAEPVGFAVLTDRQLGEGTTVLTDPAPEGLGAFLSKLYLLPAARGTGAAAALVRAGMQHAAATGAGHLWLTVNVDNHRANRFYERMGLRVIGAARFPFGAIEYDDHVRAIALG